MLKNSNINMMQNANLVLSKYAHSKKVLTVFVSVVKTKGTLINNKYDNFSPLSCKINTIYNGRSFLMSF